MAPKQLTPWLNHLKKFKKAHPTLSHKTAVKRASKAYRLTKKTTATKKKTKASPRRVTFDMTPSYCIGGVCAR
jgi:hypothetical protein